MAVVPGRSRKGNTMPTRSKAAILVASNAPLVIDDVTFPDPQPDQVLIKVEMAMFTLPVQRHSD
jgi:Zn-dependent alcohol dehydrogenase